jgi:hypothetical protein
MAKAKPTRRLLRTDQIIACYKDVERMVMKYGLSLVQAAVNRTALHPSGANAKRKKAKLP